MRKILLILILLAACVLPQQSSAQVVLKTDTVEVACSSSSVILVPIRLRNFTDIAGLQFTFQWDATHLNYEYITDINPEFVGVAFDSTTLISQGKFTFGWSQLNSLTLAQDEVLLKVAFTRIGGPATQVTMTNSPTDIFVFDGDFNEVPVTVAPGMVKPIDAAPPSITCPANLTVQGVGPTPANGIAPTPADDCGTPVVGWTSTGATTGSFPGDNDASGALFNIGTSTVTYTATDIADNTATCSFNVTVEFSVGDDLTFLTVIPPATCGQNIGINVTAYNFDNIAAFQYSMGWDPALLHFDSVTNFNQTLGLVPSNFGTGSTGIGQFSLGWDGPFTGTNLPDATVLYTMYFTVLGPGALNFNDIPTTRFAFAGPTFPPTEIPMVTVNGNITVTDDTAPTITCPASVTVQAPGSIAVQNIAPASVIDNCAAPVVGWAASGATISNQPADNDASGALFNQGNTTVTYTATDASGNTATCSFNVNVEFGAGTTDLTLVANSATAPCNGDFFIDVTTLNFDTIAALQFSMGWDTALIQYNSVSNFNPNLNLNQANFGETFTNIGQFSFGWTGPITGVSLNDGDVLFRLHFTLLGGTGGPITFTNIPTNIQAFSGASFPPNELNVVTFDGQVSVLDNVAPTIVCPANVSVDAPSGTLEATVNGLAPTTLSDNCSGDVTLTYTQTGSTPATGTGNAGGVFQAGTTTVTYTAADGAGNTATCSFTVFVDAGTPVVLHIDTIQTDCQGANATEKFCITVDNFTSIIGLQFGLEWDETVLELVPPPTNVYPGFTINSGMFFSYSTANSGLLLFFGSIPSWPDIPTGDTLFCLNFNVLNPSGTSALTFQGPFNAVQEGTFALVPVQATNGLFTSGGDNTPPVVTCPADVTVNPPATECVATYIPDLPTATDACGTLGSITRLPAGNSFNSGVTTVTYTVEDNANNSATCSFTVTVTDANPPQMFSCPLNLNVDAAANACEAPATWTAPAFNDCSAITVSNNYFPGDLFPASCQPSTVVYTATDAFGNKTTCQFTVTVHDVTPPTVVCPADIVLFPSMGCDTVLNYTMPVGTDFCSSTVDVNPDVPPGSPVPPGTSVVTIFATDECNNTAQCTFNVTVVDGAPPVIAGCPTDIVEVAAPDACGAFVSWTEPTATDICDPVVSLVASDPPGLFFQVGFPITVTYTATDDSGNLSTCEFTVTVEDHTAPVLSNCPTGPIVVLLPTNDCDTTISWVSPTVTDNCTNFTVVSNFTSPHTFGTGDTLVTYIVTDPSGNADTCSFQVVVRDNVPPVLSGCPANITTEDPGADCKAPAFWTEPTALDNCSIPVVTSPFPSGHEFPVGITVIQIIAEDASSNFDTCTFSVTVPGLPAGFDLASLPPNITVSACDTLMSWGLPTAVGFCLPTTVTSDPASPTNFGPGAHVITFTATDGVTTVTSTFTITVVEDVNPVMVCPTGPYVVNTGGVILSGNGFITETDTVAGCNGVQISFSEPTATDNCAVPEVAQTDGGASGSIFTVGDHVLTFTATDGAENTVTCSVTVSVVELAALNPVADPNPGCANEVVVITADNIPGATYAWVKLPNTVLASTTNQYTILSLSAQTAGQYGVIANVNGCLTPADTVTVQLITAPAPVNDLFTIAAGALDTFNVFLNDGIANPEDYQICNILPDPLHAGLTYIGNGNFVYQEQSGEDVSFSYQICFCGNPGEMATATIMVSDSECTFIPNIITPNGDGLNDWFTIPCLGAGRTYPDNSLVVYNQWGDKVFEDKGYTNDPNDATHPAWRGTLNGEAGRDLPDGVYYYIFKPGPTDKPIKGFVEIFR